MTAAFENTHPTSSGVTLRWLMEDAITENAGQSLARMTVAPGVTSEAHRHPNCTETIHVLSGRVEQRRGNDWIELDAGDTILIRQGETHQTRNIGIETADLILAYSSGSRVYET
jgi:mannose-6-phosphate isomerase-like protein (cupin superfamily)